MNPPSTWSRNIPATNDQVREARHFIAAILSGHPAADAAVSCVSELAANASTHSRSALPGGSFTVRLRRSGPAIRIEVKDDGGPWRSQPVDPEHGRGLLIIQALSSRCGICVKGSRANPDERTVWFEIDPPHYARRRMTPAPQPALPPPA